MCSNDYPSVSSHLKEVLRHWSRPAVDVQISPSRPMFKANQITVTYVLNRIRRVPRRGRLVVPLDEPSIVRIPLVNCGDLLLSSPNGIQAFMRMQVLPF